MNQVFVNDAINDAIVLYTKCKDEKESLDYNSFIVCVVRMLAKIYDFSLILEAFNNKDENKFNEVLMMYGYQTEKLELFKENFLYFYEFDNGQKERSIKKKNRYFNLVQKSLIDMFILKKQKDNVSTQDIEEFYEMLFTINSKDFYKKSYALLAAYNPYEIDEYFKKQGLL